MTDLDNYETYPLRIERSHELEQMLAPVWFRYFDGCHNGMHFAMRDYEGSFYHLDGAFGSYELSGTDVNGGYPNACDTFWNAGHQAGISRTDQTQPSA